MKNAYLKSWSLLTLLAAFANCLYIDPDIEDESVAQSHSSRNNLCQVNVRKNQIFNLCTQVTVENTGERTIEQLRIVQPLQPQNVVTSNWGATFYRHNDSLEITLPQNHDGSPMPLHQGETVVLGFCTAAPLNPTANDFDGGPDTDLEGGSQALSDTLMSIDLNDCQKEDPPSDNL